MTFRICTHVYKSQVEELVQRFEAAAPKADSTVRTIEAYTVLKALRHVLGGNDAENGLIELLTTLESE